MNYSELEQERKKLDAEIAVIEAAIEQDKQKIRDGLKQSKQNILHTKQLLDKWFKEELEK